MLVRSRDRQHDNFSKNYILVTKLNLKDRDYMNLIKLALQATGLILIIVFAYFIVQLAVSAFPSFL